MAMNTLKISNCILEPQDVSHAPEMFRVLSDPAIYEFENEPPVSEQWLARRFAFLESRQSQDGTQKWLNWVVRMPDGKLAGYVQATVLESGAAYVAYELQSLYWRRGLGSSAVAAVLQELSATYLVHTAVAVLKTANYRSVALLERLGFSPAGPAQAQEFEAEEDERVMVKSPCS